MKFPKLVNKYTATVPCHIVVFGEDLSEDGEPIKVLEIDALCNYNDKASFIYSNQTAQTKITAECDIDGDIAPNIAEIPNGKVTVFGVDRKITSGQKNRNPDGSVNYTRLLLE